MESHVSLDVLELSLPHAHHKIRLSDLQPDGRLLTQDQVVAVTLSAVQRRATRNLMGDPYAQVIIQKNAKKNQFGMRHKKADINSPYGIIEFDEEYYAIYRGVKQNCHIGEGGEGYAKLAQNIKTGEWVVIKLGRMIHDDHVEFEILQKLGRGIGQLEYIAHGGSHYMRKQVQERGYASSNQNIILMSLAPGVTLNIVRDQKEYRSDADWLNIILKILEEYSNLAKLKLIHCDVKLTNIFYDAASDQVTFIDFGAAKIKPMIGPTRGAFWGTPGYIAPELAQNSTRKFNYSIAIDIYALGATILYLLMTKDDSLDCNRLQNEVLRKTVSEFCLQKMCHESPNKRPKLSEIIEFFKTMQASVLSLLPTYIKKVAIISLDELLAIQASMHEALLLQPVATSTAVVQPSDKRSVLDSITSIVNRFLQPEESKMNSAQQAYDNKNSDWPIVRHAYFLEALELFDQIWVIDSIRRTNKEYISIRRTIEDQGLYIGNRCFIVNSEDVTTRIDLTLQKIYNAKLGKANKYFYVTTKPEQVNLTNIPSQQLCLVPITTDFNRVVTEALIHTYLEQDEMDEYTLIQRSLSALEEQVSHVDIRLAIKVLIDEMAQRHTHHTLTYAFVADSLKDIKDSLAKTKSEKRSLTSSHQLSMFNVSARKQVETLETQLKSWVSWHR